MEVSFLCSRAPEWANSWGEGLSDFPARKEKEAVTSSNAAQCPGSRKGKCCLLEFHPSFPGPAGPQLSLLRGARYA